MTYRLKLNIFILLLIFGGTHVYSQSIHYTPLLCEGYMPDDFSELSSSKVRRNQQQIDTSNQSEKEKENQIEFALNSYYAVDQILLSGQVLFGDPLTNYLNRLAKIVLKKQPVLLSQLRFYALKSSIPNAFSTNQGIIFISVGLMAQVENEAQLAFIMCHEISHYTEKHTYQSFKKSKDIRLGKGQYKNLEFEEKLKKFYTYSKENELEADRKGFELYKQTEYSQGEAISSFDMLLFSYLPFDEVEWKPTYFEDSFFRFPKTLFLKDVKEISADEAEDDETHTHPNVGKRKDALKEMLDSNNLKNTLSLTPEGEFETTQHQARIEISFIYIIHAEFEKAFYHAYLLEKKYNDYYFANRVKAMSLYGIYKHKLAINNFNFAKYHDYEGESQRSYYFFSKIGGQDLNILASREIWNYYLENKDDPFLKNLAYESLSDVFKKSKFERNFFETIGKMESLIKDTLATKDTELLKKETKIEKIKKQKSKNLITDTTSYNSNFGSMAFMHLFKNPIFKNALTEVLTPEQKKQEIVLIPEKNVPHKLFNKGDKLGIDTLLMINPSYIGPISKAGIRDRIEEEKKQFLLANSYKTLAKKNQLQLTMLNSLDKFNLNTYSWNNFMQLNQWLVERLSNDSVTMTLYFKDFVDGISKQYNTHYFAVSGFRYFGGIGFNVFRKPNLLYYMVVFDTKTSQLVFLDYRPFLSLMGPSLINGTVYNSFYRIRLIPKK